MKTFKNKVVVITGAASGMGRAYALAFAKLGALVAICDVDEAGLGETQRQIQSCSDVHSYSAVVDISSEKAVYDFADAVKAELGNAHVIVNNAGVEGGGRPCWGVETATMERVMSINFYGVVFGTRAFLPHLLDNGEGAVVNISSVFGMIGTPNNSDYCASKFAVRGFSESLMVELTDTPISVHLVHPGGIATNIVRNEDQKEIAGNFLTTPAEDIVDYVIASIKRGDKRIVYGNGAFSIWLVTRLLSLKVQCALLWRFMGKQGAGSADYQRLIR